MAVSLPEGFYLAVGTLCTHTGKTEMLESNALEALLHDNQKSVDTYPNSLFLPWDDSEAHVPHCCPELPSGIEF